jgi:hypothetical protein
MLRLKSCRVLIALNASNRDGFYENNYSTTDVQPWWTVSLNASLATRNRTMEQIDQDEEVPGVGGGYLMVF